MSGHIANNAAAPRLKSLPDLVVLAVGLIVCLGACLLLMQIVVLLLSSARAGLLTEAGAWTVANFTEVFAHPLFGPVLANTILLAAGSTVIMLAFAVPFALLYTRTALPGKGLLIALLTANIAIPGFLVALGYVLLFNPSNGIGNQALRTLLGLRQAPFNVYSLPWIILLQGSALAAPCFFMIVPTFRAIDGALEEAAWVSGIRRLTALARIVLPLAAPALLATATYYFIISAEIFDYASILGLPARLYVVSTWLYQMVHPADGVPRYGQAAALGTITTGAAVLLTLLYLRATRRAARYIVVTGKRRTQRQARLSPAAAIAAWLFIGGYGAVALAVPLATLLWSSLLPYLQLPGAAAFASLTLDAYTEALAELPPLLRNTVTVVLAVPTISVVLAACIAWVSTRTRLPGRRALDLLVMAAIAVPSIVGALAFLYFGLAIYRLVPLYTSIWLIVLAMATRYVTWANRTLSSAMLQVHPELEEACRTSGLRRGTGFLRVLLPTVGQAVLFSWFWLGLLALRELTIPVMLARADTDVLSTAIFGLNNAGSGDVASAMGVLLVAVILVLVAIFHRLAGQRAL